MSIPIRPPGGPVIPGVSGVEGASEIQPGQAVDVGAIAGAGGAGEAQAAEAAGPTADVLARLEAGEITREQAIDSLVAQALEAAHGGARLPAAQRQELGSVLRAALMDDPALGRLLGAD